MADNVLLLHIGTPKTGTSSLQSFLFDNRKELENYGWSYPDINSEWGRNMETYEQRIRNGYHLSFVHNGKWRNARLWEIVKKHLQTNNVIISNENFWLDSRGATTVDKLAEFKRRYENIKCVVYLRRQDLYLESYWNYVVKSGANENDFMKFCDTSEFTKKATDYLTKIREIEPIIGKENIIIRIFEKEQMVGKSGDIRSDFLNVLSNVSGPIDDDEMVFKTIINESLSDDALSLALIFNDEYHKKGLNPINELSPVLEYISKNMTNGKKGSYFSADERRRVLEKYEENNRIIAKEYLCRRDGVLFYNNIQLQEWNPKLFSKKEEDLIRLIANQVAIVSNKTGRIYAYNSGKAVILRILDLYKELFEIIKWTFIKFFRIN